MQVAHSSVDAPPLPCPPVPYRAFSVPLGREFFSWPGLS